MIREKTTAQRIGNYKNLEVWTSNSDYWVEHDEVAVHSHGMGSGKSRIFIRGEAYDIINKSPKFKKFLQTIYSHEYKEFLKDKGKAKSPHKKGRSSGEQELDKFLKENKYFEKDK